MKHLIQNRDKFRAILTDLIPYEVPLRFSFLHLHHAIETRAKMQYWTRRLFDKSIAPKSCLPYLYSIRRNEGKKRILGLIHPLILEDAASIYSKYDGVILSLCKKSSWSLRSPTRTAKMYFAREDRPADAALAQAEENDTDDDTQEVDHPTEVEKIFQENASSYFVYEPCNLLQKFFESKELLSIERRFAKCRRVDVAKCFDNIYSHSFSWAVKGKATAKAEKSCSHTFDARFDGFMQRSNHRETHGILIGSELSRVFAEIIFQDIDAQIKNRLNGDHSNSPTQSKKTTILDGRDYTIRRYIDDYFIFYNDINIADEAQIVLESTLASYKLFLNEKKTADITRPFTTNISAAKREVRELIKKNLDFNEIEFTPSADNPIHHTKNQFHSEKILCELRLIISIYNVSIADISASTLKQLGILTNRKLALFKSNHPSIECAYKWIKCILEIGFFLFSVDLKFRLSVLLGRIITDLAEAIPSLPTALANDTEDIIIRETSSILKQVIDTQNYCSLELANFLICLRGIRQYWRIPESLIHSLLTGYNASQIGKDYFSIIPLIYFTGDRAEYNQIQSTLITAGIERINEVSSLIEDTELLSLSLDLLSCPWVDAPRKEIIALKMMKSLGTPNPIASEVSAMIKEFSNAIWLFDWRTTVSNNIYLQKKELSLSY